LNAVDERIDAQASSVDVDHPKLHAPLVIGSGPENRLIIGQRSNGTVSLIDPVTGVSSTIQVAKTISDAAWLPAERMLIVADDTRGELVCCQMEDWELQLVSRTVLDSSPEQRPLSAPSPVQPIRLAVSDDASMLCVSLRWEKQAVCFSIREGTLVPLKDNGVLPLDFCPNCVTALPGRRFVIADAFGGKLVLVQCGNAVRSVASQELFGHHIGGLAVSDDGQRLLVSHQVLSRLAHTTQDDIHWGSLMQNVVSLIAADTLELSAEQFDHQRRVIPVGDTGGAAADPVSVAFWRDGLVVSSAGSDRVWSAASMNEPLVATPVGNLPSSMVMLPDDRVATGNLFDNTVSVVALAHNQVTRTIGTSWQDEAPTSRGERLFYSGALSHDRWMSCSSCHVDGHTCDLLADTLGDGGFGSAKRIPSLFGAGNTGPWGWLGNKSGLEQQLRQTLTSTMHGEHEEQTISDLSAFLNTLMPPEVSPSVQSLPGALVFASRGCSTCHAAENLTSSKTYRVGLIDELGHEYFNPPSLRGLRFRSRFGHDGRFHSIEELLQSHPPDIEKPLSQRERLQLMEFLLSV